MNSYLIFLIEYNILNDYIKLLIIYWNHGHPTYIKPIWFIYLFIIIIIIFLLYYIRYK